MIDVDADDAASSAAVPVLVVEEERDVLLVDGTPASGGAGVTNAMEVFCWRRHTSEVKQ